MILKCKIVPDHIPLSLLLSLLFTQNEFAFFRGGPRSYKQAIGITPAILLGPLQSHRAARSGPSGPPCSEEVGSRPRTFPTGVASGSSTSGSSSCSISLAERVGREVDTAAALPDPRPCPGVGAHQSIAASMPWFPVRARAFSLGAETP